MNEKIEVEKKIDYRGLILLSMGHLVADLNVSAVPALLPFLKNALGLSYAIAGTIVLCSNATGSVIQPAFGYLADRKSMLWFLPLGCFCAGLGITLLGWASGYGHILLLVLLSGLGVAMYHPEGWRAANSFAGEKKATGISIFAMGGNFGFALGPLMAVYCMKNFGLKGSAYFFVPGAAMAGGRLRMICFIPWRPTGPSITALNTNPPPS